MSQARNKAIDWLKGVMILFVVLLHTCQVSVLRHGYIAVDMFFFIAGFYLMQSFDRKPTTAIRYTWARIKQFFLPYLLCFAFSCLLRYKGLTSFTDFDSFMERYAKFGFYLTLTEEIGPQVLVEHILQGSWFISVLLIAGFLLYGMLEYNRELTVKVLIPFIFILGYTFVFTNSPVIMNWSRVGAVSIPLLRGLCAMSGGAWLNWAFSHYHDAIARRSTLVNVGGILSFALFIAIMFTEKPFDLYLIVTVPWIVLAAVISGSWFNGILNRIHVSFFSFIGRFTIYILFAHPPIVMIVNWVNDKLLGSLIPPAGAVAITLAGTAVATLVLVYVCRFIERKWLKSNTIR